MTIPSPKSALRRVIAQGLDASWLATAGWSAASVAYLTVVLTSAAGSNRDGPTNRDAPTVGGSREPFILVLVPAHDEQPVVEATVRALLETDYPVERRSVVVIADNCSDDTAGLARSAGADVWERHDNANRGKGAALAWALARGFAEHDDLNAVLVVDADCVASGNLLTAIAARLIGGASAVQVDYVAGNAHASPMAALRAAAFLLMNTVRPMGKARLGLSAGLLGTGMAFSRRALEQVPWSAFSVTEDREYHLRLVLQGMRVDFAPEARVVTPVPVTLSQGSAQQLRWDTGNALLTRQWLRRLTIEGLRRRDPHLLHAAVELLVPPQATISSLTLAGLVIACLRRSRYKVAVGVGSIAAQGLYVLLGVALVGSPAMLIRALPAIPQLVVARVRQQAKIARGQGSDTWVRTERAA